VPAPTVLKERNELPTIVQALPRKVKCSLDTILPRVRSRLTTAYRNAIKHATPRTMNAMNKANAWSSQQPFFIRDKHAWTTGGGAMLLAILVTVPVAGATAG
jgi:hypothetical protein